jgi:NitT/TauT family transport system permease protein
MNFTFGNKLTKERVQAKGLKWMDGIAIVAVAILIYLGVRLAINAPAVIRGPHISLDPTVLPWYALFSVSRMAGAYLLSLVFTLFYGRTAAYHKNAEKVMMPLLDILQCVPILSFLPVVLLGLSSFLPVKVAAELASVVLIFTSQAWNLTFAWYQSLTTIPKELREANATFRLNTWLQFKTMEVPFAMISLIWNSMMSWAGGWFFLMAAEIFTVGQRDFRLPGLGAYLHEASQQNDFRAIAWGLGTLILIVILLDQFVWRPLIAWADRFKIEMIESDNPPTSWFYSFIHNSALNKWLGVKIGAPLIEKIDLWSIQRSRQKASIQNTRRSWGTQLFKILALAGLIYGLFQTILLLLQVPGTDWVTIGLSVLATTLRVGISLLLALAWTIPVGVAIGTNPRISTILQPLVQITASVPATALFPVLLVFILGLPGGLNLAAVILMLLGTQWYLLFNIIAGANAIPQDLKYTAALLRLNRFERWRTLILPALFPYLVTGAITASGGAWNASIVAEYVTFGGKTYQTLGIGSLIAQSTANGNYPVLLAGTLCMILAVVLINRLVWRSLYRLAEDSYRME